MSSNAAGNDVCPHCGRYGIFAYRDKDVHLIWYCSIGSGTISPTADAMLC